MTQGPNSLLRFELSLQCKTLTEPGPKGTPPAVSALRGGCLINLQHLAGCPGPTEARGLLTAATDQAGAQFFVQQHVADTPRDIEDVLRVDQHRRIAHHFGERTYVRCDYRRAASHGFERR